MTAEVILETVNAAGGQLWLVDGERLRYRLPESLAPLVEVLQERKLDIIEALAQRPPMPAGVRLLSWNPKAAPVQISRCSTVTDVGLFIRSTLRQVEAQLAGQSWKAGNWGLHGLLDRLAAVGCVVALDNPRRGLQ